MPDELNDDVPHDQGLEQAAARRSSGIARDGDAGDGGPPAERSGPDTGTAAGSPVAGREIDRDVASDAIERAADAEE
jgi:hypothetical protein